MELMQLIPSIYEHISIYLLIFTRIAALFFVFVLFRRWMVSMRVIMSLTAIISFYVMMLSPSLATINEPSPLTMLIHMLIQAAIGFGLAIFLNIIFEIFSAMGQVLSSQMGLTAASQFDPRFGMITTLTNAYVLIASLIFLNINGHIFVVKLITESFSAFPLLDQLFPVIIMKSALAYSANIFSQSVLASISLILTLLITNISLAVMSKFAPQINLFSIGLNLSLILGLFFLVISFPIFLDIANEILKQGMSQVLSLTKV